MSNNTPFSDKETRAIDPRAAAVGRRPFNSLAMPGFSATHGAFGGPYEARIRVRMRRLWSRAPSRLSRPRESAVPGTLRLMADQIVLEWTVDVAGSILDAAGAATALGAVPLYRNPTNDPVLGQLFGLTVDSDVTAAGVGVATRTLTLNLNSVNAPEAPPVFPCHPNTSTPPVPPYPLVESITLGGSFFPQNGLAAVPTTQSQLQTLGVGSQIQFLSQLGVFYEIMALTDTELTLTAAYTGTTANTGAFFTDPAPVTLAAIYSTSELDTDAVAATTPAIAAGAGARTIELTYDDSVGGGPFTVTVNLTGKRPAPVTLDAGSVDIAEIISMVVATAGTFENNVGELTLVELSSALAPLPGEPPPTPDFFRSPATDAGQLLIERHLAYLPPSYLTLAQQGTSFPQLAGDFFVSTGSSRVTTSVDQSAVLAQGDVIRFASQFTLNTLFETQQRLYTVDVVTPTAITLTEAYDGIDDNFTGTNNVGVNSNKGTKGNIGSSVLKKATAAFLVDPAAATIPTNAQSSAPLGQFVAPATAGPPPPPPLSPATIPTPTFLSDLFTQTIQTALAGVPVTPSAIAFLP